MAGRLDEFHGAAVPESDDGAPGAQFPTDRKINRVQRVDLQHFARYY
jgi:hypothetical protein